MRFDSPKCINMHLRQGLHPKLRWWKLQGSYRPLSWIFWGRRSREGKGREGERKEGEGGREGKRRGWCDLGEVASWCCGEWTPLAVESYCKTVFPYLRWRFSLAVTTLGAPMQLLHAEPG